MRYFFIISVLLSSNAIAYDKVSSPNVEKGKLELEYRADYDPDPEKSDHQTNKFIANYGVTDRIRPELEFIVDTDMGKDPVLAAFAASVKYQFFKPDEAWLSSAVELGYEHATLGGEPDSAEVKFLFNRSWDKYVVQNNITFGHEIGEHSEDGIGMKLGLLGLYKWTDYVAPALEFYVNTGNFNDDLEFNEQKYQFGPAIHGKIDDNFKYQLGYLFGISDAATDNRLKFILTYQQKF